MKIPSFKWHNSSPSVKDKVTSDGIIPSLVTIIYRTVTTSDGRRAGKDAGTTDQTILMPVRAGYHIVENNLNYAYFYPTFGQ